MSKNAVPLIEFTGICHSESEFPELNGFFQAILLDMELIVRNVNLEALVAAIGVACEAFPGRLVPTRAAGHAEHWAWTRPADEPGLTMSWRGGGGANWVLLDVPLAQHCDGDPYEWHRWDWWNDHAAAKVFVHVNASYARAANLVLEAQLVHALVRELRAVDWADELEWVWRHGPHCPELYFVTGFVHAFPACVDAGCVPAGTRLLWERSYIERQFSKELQTNGTTS